MGKPTGFMEIKREEAPKKSASERAKDWEEFVLTLPEETLQKQGSRCMDCGIPFCQTGLAVKSNNIIGCPLQNLIPEWNDLVYRGRWKDALERLHKTNNFPEFTGRVCPAPCEGSCVVAISGDAVTIKNIEYTIVEKGFKEGWIVPNVPKNRTGKQVAVIGSGPAGLAAAAELNKQGHLVTVFEREDRIGGLLAYGIPSVKLSQDVINRRVNLLKEEGINFVLNTTVGKDISAKELKKQFDAVILCTGSTKPRDVNLPGRHLKGIYFALNYLTQSTKNILDSNEFAIDVKDKNVIVIGGGDTGADCISTAVRQGAKSVVQFDINQQKPNERTEDNPWPLSPFVYTLEDGQKEALAVYGKNPLAYKIQTKQFIGNENDVLTEMHTIQVETILNPDGTKTRKEISGTEEVWKADFVFLAVGFTGPEDQIIEAFALEQDIRTNIKADFGKYETNVEGVFAAGDNRRGQSLVVWAIREGREAAKQCDKYLTRACSH